MCRVQGGGGENRALVESRGGHEGGVLLAVPFDQRLVRDVEPVSKFGFTGGGATL